MQNLTQNQKLKHQTSISPFFVIILKFEQMHESNLTIITMQYTQFLPPHPPTLFNEDLLFLPEIKRGICYIEFFKRVLQSNSQSMHKDENLRRGPFFLKKQFNYQLYYFYTNHSASKINNVHSDFPSIWPLRFAMLSPQLVYVSTFL